MIEKTRDLIFRKARARLGAPIIKVELTDEMMYFLWEDAKEMSHFLCKESTNFKAKHFLSKQYFYASCKETLGLVRGKYSGVLPIPGTSVKLDYESLAKDGAREKRDVIALMLDHNNRF